MAALTLRIPSLEARRELEAGETTPARPLVLRLPAPKASTRGEAAAGKVCCKCKEPLPDVKWPWKRCLQCRLRAEKPVHQSKTSATRVPCTVCSGLTPTPPLCYACRRLGLTGSLANTNRTQQRPDRPLKRRKSNIALRPPPTTPITPLVADYYGDAHAHAQSSRSFNSFDASAAAFVSPDWSLDRIIDKLATAKHFNDRGEYIFPQFLPPDSIARTQHTLPAYTPQPAQVCRSPSCGRLLDSIDVKRKLCKQCVAAVMNDARLYDRTNYPSLSWSSWLPPTTSTPGVLERAVVPPSVIDLTISSTTVGPEMAREMAHTPAPAVTTVDPSMLTLRPPPPTAISPMPPPPLKLASPAAALATGGDEIQDDEIGDEEDEDEGVPGWDSDLTELSQTEESSEEDVPLKDCSTTASPSHPTPTPTPLRIKLPAHTILHPTHTRKRKRKPKPPHVCQQSRCENLLTRNARWKMCLSCRVRTREYERARKGGYFKWLKSDGEEEEEEKEEGEMVVLFGGRRKCAIRTCVEIIPPLSTYRWKLCEACRQRTRRRARELKYAARLWSDCEDDEEEEEDDEVPLAKKLARKKQIQSLKGVRLTFKGKTVASVDTRAQASSGKGADTAASVVKREVVARSMLKPDTVDRAPMYQSFETLLGTLRHLLTTYVKAHDIYVVMQLASAAANEEKGIEKKKALPAIFSFQGEFSVVADPAGGDVGGHIDTVATVIGRYLGVSLVPAELAVDATSGTVTATYSCSHEAIVNIPPSILIPPAATNLLPPPPALLRKLSGELTIIVSWDRSHLYFPGMRTVVSFCLIG